MRQFLHFSLAMLLSLASANAYTLEQPQLPEQIEAAILLNEDGTPRCRIGSAAELDASLDSLRECDERDELYARTIFDTEEISLGIAAPLPLKISAVLFNIGTMGLSGCLVGSFFDLPEKKGLQFWIPWLGGMVVGLVPTSLIVRNILVPGFTTTIMFDFLTGGLAAGTYHLASHCGSI